jgi:hypothetical protein
MDWSAEQKAELTRQYIRIGYRPGEQWAAPPEELSPEQLLALMRTIPDGAGHAGWLVALSRNA